MGVVVVHKGHGVDGVRAHQTAVQDVGEVYVVASRGRAVEVEVERHVEEAHGALASQVALQLVHVL